MNPIDCAARNEGGVCLSCEAWEAGVRAGETVLMSLAQPNTDSLDETERGVLLDFMESLGFSARVALDHDHMAVTREHVETWLDLDRLRECQEDDGEP